MLTISINKKLVKPKDARVSVLSSIGRGYGVFETLRTYKNKFVFQADEHIERLFKSGKSIDLEIKYSKEEIFKMLQKVVKKSPHKIQRIKIIVIEEALIIISMPLKIKKEIYKGVSCKSFECSRFLPEVKSISYLSSFLCHERAAKEGFYDAILINKNGEVFEGAYSNIFWFEKNFLCTRNNEILKGITREIILKISPFKVKFKKIKLSKLIKKQEIFLTQSTTGIVPIVKINNHIIGDGKIGEKTSKLIKLLNNFIFSKSPFPNKKDNDN